MTTVISVEHLSKSYRLGQINTGTFTYDLQLWWAKLRGKPNPFLRVGETGHDDRDGETIWALKDVSFQVQQGEVLGIIGRNGAGKSTLLKILSRVTAPTSGKVKIKGRIASLLEVGTGFHPDLTGRENVYLNGAIMGMSKQEVARKFDEIVDFSGVEQFIDTPVKRYSSGMYVRLAFAVAAHLDPEILVVDEVLAVGDADFQKKCVGKMGEVAKHGRTVLFVSHNMGVIRQLCKKGMVLRKGALDFNGKINHCVDYYMGQNSTATGLIVDHIVKQDSRILVQDIQINSQTSDDYHLNSEETSLKFFVSGFATAHLRIDLEIRILDIFGNVLGLYSPGHRKGFSERFQPGPFTLERTLELPAGITRGIYYLNISLTDPDYQVWVDIPKAVHIVADGTATASGRPVEYSGGTGWLFLK